MNIYLGIPKIITVKVKYNYSIICDELFLSPEELYVKCNELLYNHIVYHNQLSLCRFILLCNYSIKA